MCFRYRPGEAGGARGREASGSKGQEEREEGEALHWHRSAGWRGKKGTTLRKHKHGGELSANQVEDFCSAGQSKGLFYC